MALRRAPQRRHADDQTRASSARGRRATRAGGWSSRSSAARSDIPRRRSSSTGRAGSSVGGHTWRRTRGGPTTWTDVCASSPRSVAVPLGRIGVEDVRGLVAKLAEQVAAEEVAAKTVNNTLGTLVVCLNAALEDGLIATNPAMRVERLPAAHIEREYLRLHEIPLVSRFLRGRLPSAGRGADRHRDADIRGAGAAGRRRRARADPAVRSRSTAPASARPSARRSPIASGPSRSARRSPASSLTNSRGGLSSAPGPTPKAALFVMPVRERQHGRGRWASAGAPAPLDRTTVSREWHKEALADAELRDMPLHSLRHTAAAAWLAAGNSLMYVQRQLGTPTSRRPSVTTATSSATSSPPARWLPRKPSRVLPVVPAYSVQAEQVNLRADPGAIQLGPPRATRQRPRR